MANKYCSECGAKLNENEKFCHECGTAVIRVSASVQNEEKAENHRTEFAGKVIKCPNCGNALDSFDAICPSCGCEIREKNVTNTIREFEKRLSEIESLKVQNDNRNSVMKKVFGKDLANKKKEASNLEEQKNQEKINLIKNFPIPNTKEDVVEFFLLVAANISVKGENATEAEKKTGEAWVAKFDQIYQKAEIILNNDSEFLKIEEIYYKKQKEIRIGKIKKIALMVAFIPMMLAWFSIIPFAEGEILIGIILVLVTLIVVGIMGYMAFRYVHKKPSK